MRDRPYCSHLSFLYDTCMFLTSRDLVYNLQLACFREARSATRPRFYIVMKLQERLRHKHKTAKHEVAKLKHKIAKCELLAKLQSEFAKRRACIARKIMTRRRAAARPDKKRDILSGLEPDILARIGALAVDNDLPSIFRASAVCKSMRAALSPLCKTIEAKERPHIEQRRLNRELAAELAAAREAAAAARAAKAMKPAPTAQSQIAERARDPRLCLQYSKEIDIHLRELELEHRASPYFMHVCEAFATRTPDPDHCRCLAPSPSHRPPSPHSLSGLPPLCLAPPSLPMCLSQSQRDINAKMRGILIDWLAELNVEVTFQDETLYLAVNYIDRFLSHVPVCRSKLQLVGVACFFIAAKYEETDPWCVDELVVCCDNTYKREEILRMERTVLNRLNFELSVATTKCFINRFHASFHAGEQLCDSMTEMLCKYLCELTLQEYAFLKYRPSEIAAAGLLLALHTMTMHTARRITRSGLTRSGSSPASLWTPLLEQASGYGADELADCVAKMHTVYRKAETSDLQAVREKYAREKFLSVAMLTPPDTPPG